MIFSAASGCARREAVPSFSRDDYDRAWERWKQVEPANYAITIRVEGRQPATYQVTVVDGEVATASRNGYPLTQIRTMGTWSVPGMFDTMEYDLEAVHAEGDQPVGTQALSLRAEFEATYGYPRRYLRSDAAMGTTTYWIVESFEPHGVAMPSESTEPNPPSDSTTTNPTSAAATGQVGAIHEQ